MIPVHLNREFPTVISSVEVFNIAVLLLRLQMPPLLRSGCFLTHPLATCHRLMVLAGIDYTFFQSRLAREAAVGLFLHNRKGYLFVTLLFGLVRVVGHPLWVAFVRRE